MRIGVVAPPWTPIPPRGYGGIARIVDRLARGYQASGHEVTLFATGDSTCPVPLKWALPAAAVNSGTTPAGDGRRLAPERAEALRVHLTAAYDALAGCDIVHDHTVTGPRQAERHPGLRVVTTLHSTFGEGTVEAYRRIGDRVPIIAVSEDQRRQAPELPIARMIPHGIDAAGFPFGAGEDGHLLFLGRMAPEKGVVHAIEAATIAGVPLVIAAKMREPWEFRYFQTHVEPRLNDRVRYVGEVDGQEKGRLLAGARALLNPVVGAEAFGLVMIEAMACGTPVLAYPAGAATEIIDDGRTGVLCHDVASMADAIGLIDRLDRAACRRTAETRFSADRMVAEHLTFFAELLGHGSAG